MKLEFSGNEVTTSESFKSQNFGFGDPRVIMQILRHKMYSNPIRAICQEIMSNSRDANREAGRGDVPVIVHLPNDWDDNIKFEDNGIGVSPDRMNTVFAFYGASTKRGDNLQTGGFGLGAKTPFAYTDTFTILTTTEDESGVVTQRTYIAYLDDSELGAISLAQETVMPPGTPTGTIISLAVESKDIKTFKTWVKRSGNFWKVLPEIKGDASFNWEEDCLAAWNEGDEKSWSLAKTGVPRIIIDGIPYEINLDMIYPELAALQSWKRESSYTDIQKVLTAPVRLYFPVGELALAANRESLEYNPKTIAKVKEAAENATNGVLAFLEKSISHASNLWEASISWQEVKNSYKNFSVKPKYKGLELIKSIESPRYDYNVGTNWSDMLKIRVFEYDPVLKDAKSIKSGRSLVNKIIPEKGVVILEDDGERPNKRRLETFFTKNPNATKVGIVVLRNQAIRDKMQELYHWDKLDIGKLSDYPKAPSKNVAKRGGYTVHKVKKLVCDTTGFSAKWRWAPEDTRTAEDSLGGYCVVIKNSKILLPNGKEITSSALAEVAKSLKVPVYGMLYKWKSKINPCWVHIFDYAAKEVNAILKQKNVQDFIRFGSKNNATHMLGSEVVEALSDYKWKKNNLLAEYIRCSALATSGQSDYNRAVSISASLGLSRYGPYTDRYDYTSKRLKPVVTITESHAKALNALGKAVLKMYPSITLYKHLPAIGNSANSYHYRSRSRGKKSSQRTALSELIFYIESKSKEI
jgi:hypothetical protein